MRRKLNELTMAANALRWPTDWLPSTKRVNLVR